MTTIINANSTGLVETVDTSGTLQLQTGGTAAMTIGTDQNITCNSTGAITLPVGTTAQRPTATNGMMRYNTNLVGIEAYVGGAWTTVISSPYTVTYLAVAGGGGAGWPGAGAGGRLTSTFSASPGTVFTATVGAGGASNAGR